MLNLITGFAFQSTFTTLVSLKTIYRKISSRIYNSTLRFRDRASAANRKTQACVRIEFFKARYALGSSDSCLLQVLRIFSHETINKHLVSAHCVFSSPCQIPNISDKENSHFISSSAWWGKQAASNQDRVWEE